MARLASADQSSRPHILVHLAAAIGPVATTSILAPLATLPNIPGWYVGLAKPPLTPPNSVFGPVWTLLYILIAYAIWRVLRAAPGPDRTVALRWLYVQLALNTLWSWLFFGMRNPLLGALDIVPLLAAVLLAVAAVRRVDALAAALLAPYAAWVAYATYLNLGIWWLNRAG